MSPAIDKQFKCGLHKDYCWHELKLPLHYCLLAVWFFEIFLSC